MNNTTNCEVETHICPLRLGTVIGKNKEQLQKSQILTWEIIYELYTETVGNGVCYMPWYVGVYRLCFIFSLQNTNFYYMFKFSFVYHVCCWLCM